MWPWVKVLLIFSITVYIFYLSFSQFRILRRAPSAPVHSHGEDSPCQHPRQRHHSAGWSHLPLPEPHRTLDTQPLCQVMRGLGQIEHVTLVAITGTILVSYLQVKSLQLVWRSGTRRWNLWMPDLQMSCRDLAMWQGTGLVSSTVTAGDVPYLTNC